MPITVTNPLKGRTKAGFRYTRTRRLQRPGTAVGAADTSIADPDFCGFATIAPLPKNTWPAFIWQNGMITKLPMLQSGNNGPRMRSMTGSSSRSVGRSRAAGPLSPGKQGKVDL
jgi:hypothetical protein